MSEGRWWCLKKIEFEKERSVLAQLSEMMKEEDWERMWREVRLIFDELNQAVLELSHPERN